MPIRLRDAADRPAQISEDFPEAQRGGFDWATACSNVRVEEFLRLPDAAEALRVLPETPRANTRPCQVFRRIADVGEFPINNAVKSIGSDDQIADAEITVNQHPL